MYNRDMATWFVRIFFIWLVWQHPVMSFLPHLLINKEVVISLIVSICYSLLSVCVTSCPVRLYCTGLWDSFRIPASLKIVRSCLDLGLGNLKWPYFSRGLGPDDVSTSTILGHYVSTKFCLVIPKLSNITKSRN